VRGYSRSRYRQRRTLTEALGARLQPFHAAGRLSSARKLCEKNRPPEACSRRGEFITLPIARVLGATDRAGIEARLAEYFAADAGAELLAARDAHCLCLNAADPPRAAALAAALRAAGAKARTSGALVAIVATPAELAAVRLAAPGLAAEVDAFVTTLCNVTQPRPVFRMRDRALALRDEARVMGILNVTPDSFYERVGGPAEAVCRARAMVADGAALIDIGGQSYAHWNPRVAADEERGRVVPAVEAIVAAGVDVALSIDTFKAEVADAALAAGAHLINDCSGLADPLLAQTVARYDAALVVMHLKGELNVRSAETYVYGDALAEIVEFLYERTERARAAGVAADSIAIDPGLEFGKEPETDLEILDRFGELRALGYPILFASSRKSFIGRLFERPAKELLIPSLATAGLGIAAGARMLRVHDVAETAQLARMYAAIGPARRRALSFAEHMPGTPAQAGNSSSSSAV
jgi:dihydropteroate synthase